MNRRRALGLGTAGLALMASPFCGAAILRSDFRSDNKAAASPPQRIVAMDFGLTEMLLTLGVTPLAVSVPDWYRRTNVAPPLPASVRDIGLLYQPNLELLAQLRPGLMLITPAHRPLRAQLERIAPTLTLALSGGDAGPWQQIRHEMRHLADVLARDTAADNALRAADDTLADVRARFAQRPDITGRPLFLVEFVDDRHLLVYGADSLFGDVMTRIGLRNAWRHATNARGYAMVDFTQLADVADAQLVYIAPLPDAARVTVSRGVLWRSLPFVRAQRVGGMPKVSQGGALYTGERCARQLADVLLAGGRHA